MTKHIHIHVGKKTVDAETPIADYTRAVITTTKQLLNYLENVSRADGAVSYRQLEQAMNIMRKMPEFSKRLEKLMREN
jgi:hypothetical protein